MFVATSGASITERKCGQLRGAAGSYSPAQWNETHELDKYFAAIVRHGPPVPPPVHELLLAIAELVEAPGPQERRRPDDACLSQASVQRRRERPISSFRGNFALRSTKWRGWAVQIP